MTNQPKIPLSRITMSDFSGKTVTANSTYSTTGLPLPGLACPTFNTWWDNKTSTTYPLPDPEIDISRNSTIARLEAKIKELEDALTEHILLGKENK